MAVAVKNTSETTEQSLMDRLAVRGLLGVAYLLLCLAVVFYAIPYLWQAALTPVVGRVSLFLDGALLLLAIVLAAVGTLYLGLKLMGPSPPAGLKAAIFWGLACLAVSAVLAWSIGRLLDSWLGASGIDTAGQVIVGGIGLLFLALSAYWYLKPAREDFFVRFEEQGWFSTSQYKKSQGLKVRRGTMVGLLLLAGTGIYTMLSHQLLPRRAWQVPVPFTGMAEVRNPGDSESFKAMHQDGHFWISRHDFEQERTRVGKTLVKVNNVGDSDFEPGQLVERTKLESVAKELKKNNERPPTSVNAVEPTAATVYAWNFWLLPDMNFTVPLILVLASLWLSWRVVNFPPFADFLIATEAELNKVSWTTRKRLVQDTIVVLVTVVLFTFFLLFVDMAWSWLLTRIGIMPSQPAAAATADKEQAW